MCVVTPSIKGLLIRILKMFLFPFLIEPFQKYHLKTNICHLSYRWVKLDHFEIDPPGIRCFDWMGKYFTEESKLGIINAMVQNNWSFTSDLTEAVEDRKVLVTLLSFIQFCQWMNIPIKFLRVKLVLELKWIKRQLYVIICTYIMLNFWKSEKKK